MKRLYLCAILALILSAAILSGCAPAEDALSVGSGWTTVLECKITHPTYLAGFLNEHFGITVGLRGEIHYSYDGGQTWPEGENSSSDRFCLDIVDESIAWCGGVGEREIRVSSDGGKTWTEADCTLNMIIDHVNIDFIDDATGWIASLYKIAGTSDGGKTWTEIPMPEGADGVAAICLRTQDTGYLLSRDGKLYVTADGGGTWSSQDLEFKNYDIIDVQKQPKLNKSIPTLADISFADENNGIIVFTGKSASDKGYNTWCLTTADGGETWRSETIPETKFTPSKVFLSSDGQYLTLSDGSNNVAVLKRK